MSLIVLVSANYLKCLLGEDRTRATVCCASAPAQGGLFTPPLTTDSSARPRQTNPRSGAQLPQMRVADPPVRSRACRGQLPAGRHRLPARVGATVLAVGQSPAQP